MGRMHIPQNTITDGTNTASFVDGVLSCDAPVKSVNASESSANVQNSEFVLKFSGTAKIGFSSIGGVMVKLTNKTGSASVKGTIVEASTAHENAFAATGAEDYMPIGVVYESGIADGSECWVVIYGIAQVLLENSTSATKGYWVQTSESAAGRADATNAAPAGGTIQQLNNHMQEIGHCLEDKEAGTDVLCKIVVHFN